VIAVVVPTLGVQDGYKNALKTAGVSYAPYVVCDDNQEGFTRTVNDGLKMALHLGADHVCILNDDIVAGSRNWLARLTNVLDSTPEVGIVAPGGRCKTYPQCKGTPGLPPKIYSVKQLAFFCAVIRRDVLETVGLLDEGFIHYGSDSDYCLRALKAGYKLGYVQDVYMEHLAHQSTPRPEWKDHDTRLFQQRWG
jgi:GT2 family glycosyltransferase